MRHAEKLTLAVLAIGVLSASGTLTSAAQASSTARASEQRQTLVHDGVKRSYVIHAPDESALRKGRVPLVLVLHGGGGNAANAERMTGFSGKADSEGFIVAYPEGTSRFRDRLLTWNAGHCCGYAMLNRVDDTGFIRTLIDTLIKDYPVDPQRVYVAGMSNGSMMAHRLGRELPDRIAAIAPVVATVFGDEKMPQQAVSAIMFNGMQDTSVPHAGGSPGGRFAGAWDGTPAKPALDQVTFWSGANGCKPDAAAGTAGQDHGPYLYWQSNCPAGLGVELYLVKDTGHAWPGGQRGSLRGNDPGSSVKATDLIWSFFQAHRKQ